MNEQILSLCQRVASLETSVESIQEMIRNQSKWWYLIGGAVLVSVVSRILEAAYRNLKNGNGKKKENGNG